VVSGARVFMIDNYDSFTYNLVQVLAAAGAEVAVARNDRATVDEIAAWKPTHLVVSPGPGVPAQAGVSRAAIAHFGAAGVPVLGVCLGHQCIAEVYGGLVRRGAAPVHGKTAAIEHDGKRLYAGLPQPFTATRYHSLVVDDELPRELELSAWTGDGVVMGIRHHTLAVEGVQFHPESVLTPDGPALLENFLKMMKTKVGRPAAARER
jgi:anthranilate synthase/aminodeoxychorismate synthase-like glutamine amidotransferase